MCLGTTVTGRRPLPDPVPVKAELRLLARETLDPGEVGWPHGGKHNRKRPEKPERGL